MSSAMFRTTSPTISRQCQQHIPTSSAVGSGQVAKMSGAMVAKTRDLSNCTSTEKSKREYSGTVTYTKVKSSVHLMLNNSQSETKRHRLEDNYGVTLCQIYMILYPSVLIF